MSRPGLSQANAKALERQLHKAVQLHQQGRIEQADAIYGSILQVCPTHFDALHLRGVARQQLKKSRDALDLIGRALKLQTTAPALSNYGNVLESLNRLHDALACFEKAISISPSFAAAHASRSRVLHGLQRYDDALAGAEAALAIHPDNVDGLLNQANALLALKRPAEALASSEKLLALAPGNIQALNNRGCALMDLGRHEEAADSLERVVASDRGSIVAMNNLANLYQQSGQTAQALALYEQACKLDPDHPNLNFNAAIASLTLGDFQAGWKRYEWRWKNRLFRSRKRDFAQPVWLGNFSLQGKTILLHAEQGLGDTLQFVRYVPLVAELGASVVLEVQASLKPLLGDLPGTSVVLSDAEALPPFDCHCPLMSLPLAFGTRLETIPNRIPYLAPPGDRIAGWAGLLGGNRPRVGIAWSGSENHRHDRLRSIEFALLGDLVNEPGVDFFSLQRDVRNSDAVALAASGVVHLGDRFDDFADTAAAVSLLDLVITVDTAIAHLAGAMGQPTWILLPFWPDFRWLQEREDSPWYPAVRLFRQGKVGDWRTPIGRIGTELRRWAEARAATGSTTA